MTSGADATVFTVGHGTRATAELADILREAGVALLVDVRRYPASRRHPHFARERLAARTRLGLPPDGSAGAGGVVSVGRARPGAIAFDWGLGVMASWKCEGCGTVCEGRCRPGKCPKCGAAKERLVKA